MPPWAKWGLSLLVAVGLIVIGWHVVALLVTLHIAVCLVLVVVIMLQSGSAADLAGAFGGAGSQTAFGPRGAATFLSHATTWCAVVFMMTSLTLSVKRSPNDVSTTGSVLEQTQKSGTVPAKPAAPPTQIPLQPQPQQQPAPAQQQQAPAPQPTQNPAPKK